MTVGTGQSWTCVGRLAVIAAILSLSGVASAQQGQGERSGVGGRPATSATPDSGGSPTSGTTDCTQAIRAACSPSAGGDTRTQGGPTGGDAGAPMSGSTGSSTGTSATEGGNIRSPSDPSGARSR